MAKRVKVKGKVFKLKKIYFGNYFASQIGFVFLLSA